MIMGRWYLSIFFFFPLCNPKNKNRISYYLYFFLIYQLANLPVYQLSHNSPSPTFILPLKGEELKKISSQKKYSYQFIVQNNKLQNNYIVFILKSVLYKYKNQTHNIDSQKLQQIYFKYNLQNNS